MVVVFRSNCILQQCGSFVSSEDYVKALLVLQYSTDSVLEQTILPNVVNQSTVVFLYVLVISFSTRYTQYLLSIFLQTNIQFFQQDIDFNRYSNKYKYSCKILSRIHSQQVRLYKYKYTGFENIFIFVRSTWP